MEEKERYVYHEVSNEVEQYECYYDTEDCCELFNDEDVLNRLNQQAKQIKELEEDQALLTMLVSGIDNLMHDKDYRFKNDNGTWYSRQSCKDLMREEVYQEIIDEINQLDSNFEILDKENQQLKQQLHDLPKKIVEEIKDNCWYGGALLEDNYYKVTDKLLDTILKKFGGKND